MVLRSMAIVLHTSTEVAVFSWEFNRWFTTHISNGGWRWTALGKYPDSALICFCQEFSWDALGCMDSEVAGGRMYNCELLNGTSLQ